MIAVPAAIYHFYDLKMGQCTTNNLFFINIYLQDMETSLLKHLVREMSSENNQTYNGYNKPDT